MSAFLDKFYQLKEQFFFWYQHPDLLKAMLLNNHVLLIELLALLVFLILLLYVLLKPSVPPLPQEEEVGPIQRYSASPTVERVNAKSRPFLEKSDPQVTPWMKRTPPSIRDLSPEEEQALHEAMMIAGKQALADTTGGPRQTAFFENIEAQDAAKKMFSRQKESTLPPEDKPLIPKIEFIMLYFMAPRSHVFEGQQLFPLFQELGLFLNENHVFEYADPEGLHFYIASALKPGTFDIHQLHYTTPGLSFVLDLTQVSHGKKAFQMLLHHLDLISQHLKGDILDEHRQRLTQTTINSYLARIKAFGNLQQAEL